MHNFEFGFGGSMQKRDSRQDRTKIGVLCENDTTSAGTAFSS
jgi:hypothetical protein